MPKILMFLITAVLVNPWALAKPTTDSTWKLVPNAEVCMVTNMHFARPQIPVPQGGKTYFGCCEHCKTMIETDAASRIATDPFTGKSVDKANAAIAANNMGAVMYFEKRANLDRHLKKLNEKTNQ